MAVIINEFEVILQSPEGAEERTDQAAVAAEKQRFPTPQDIYDILRHREERMRRLWAD